MEHLDPDVMQDGSITGEESTSESNHIWIQTHALKGRWTGFRKIRTHDQKFSWELIGNPFQLVLYVSLFYSHS